MGRGEPVSRDVADGAQKFAERCVLRSSRLLPFPRHSLPAPPMPRNPWLSVSFGLNAQLVTKA
jgi:hypothetical protein